jgi:hypothetical protein
LRRRSWTATSPAGALPVVARPGDGWPDEIPLHAAIVEALERRDAPKLKTAFERHYDWIAAHPEGRGTLFRDVPAVSDLVRSRFYKQPSRRPA